MVRHLSPTISRYDKLDVNSAFLRFKQNRKRNGELADKTLVTVQLFLWCRENTVETWCFEISIFRVQLVFEHVHDFDMRRRAIRDKLLMSNLITYTHNDI